MIRIYSWITPSKVFALFTLLLLCQAVDSSFPSLTQSIKEEAIVVTANTSFFDNPVFISVTALLAFNIFIFIIVCACNHCFKLNYQIVLNNQRIQFGQKYPHVKFQTKSYCLIEEEHFYGKDCFQSNQQITCLPAFIYGRELDAEASHANFFTVRQCEKCQGLTRTLEIFKYGKLRECWETIFMIIISPCFLAFTIRRITANNILWRKFFCTNCGYEKGTRNQS